MNIVWNSRTKIRIDLDDLEKLKVFERTVDWLIDAELIMAEKGLFVFSLPDSYQISSFI